MSIASFSVDAAVGVVTALTGLIAAAVAATQPSYRHRMMRHRRLGHRSRSPQSPVSASST